MITANFTILCSIYAVTAIASFAKKDLLSKGTLEEFESLFEGKIKENAPEVNKKRRRLCRPQTRLKKNAQKIETAAESGTIEFNGRLTGNTLKNLPKKSF